MGTSIPEVVVRFPLSFLFEPPTGRQSCQLAIAVGTTIAGCPPHGPGRALISASGFYLGWIAAKRTVCPHTLPPVGHAQSRSVSGTCQMEKCSPGSAAFPPHSPPTMLRLCSNDSSVLYRCVTPRRRARGPCGLSLLPPSCG